MSERTSNSPSKDKTSQVRLALIAGVVLVLLFAMYIGWDRLYRHPVLHCGDGQRYAIDTRQFDIQYLAYSVKLEAKVKDKAVVALSADPVQEKKLSDAIVTANEFRKYVVAGYNACAITQAQYEQDGKHFQALDSMAGQIDALAARTNLTPAERASLSALIDRYSKLAYQVGTN